MTATALETISFAAAAATILVGALGTAFAKRTFHAVMALGVVLVGAGALFVLLGSPLIGILQILVYVGGILTLFVFAVMFVAGDETEGPVTDAAVRAGPWPAIASVLVAVAAVVLVFQYTFPANHAVASLFGAHDTLAKDGKTHVWVQSTLANWAGFVGGILFVVVVALVALLAAIAIRRVLTHWSGARIGALAVGILLLAVTLALATHGGGFGDVAATDQSQAAANSFTALTDALFGPQGIPLLILGVLLTAVMIGALVTARPLGAPDDATNYAPVTREQVQESQGASDPHARAPHPPKPVHDPMTPSPLTTAPAAPAPPTANAAASTEASA